MKKKLPRVIRCIMVTYCCSTLIRLIHPQESLIEPHNIQQIYKNISDELNSIRKEYPGSQSKMYTVLDHIDKMYSTVKNSISKEETLKNSLKQATLDNQRLKSEIAILKADLSKTKQSLELTQNTLETTNKKLEEEKEAAQEQLSQEKERLLSKVQDLARAQKSERHQKAQARALLQTINQDYPSGKP